MNNILAALGLAQLETMDERLAAKRDELRAVRAALGPERAARLLGQPAWSDANRWFYAYAVRRRRRRRTRLLTACLAADIQARPLWYPNHLQRALRGHAGVPRSSARVWFYERVVNLPCSVTLKTEQVDAVAALIAHASAV